MRLTEPFVDLHCHLLPGIDDGAADWDMSLAMAAMAVADGIRLIVATPHQLGGYSMNQGPLIKRLVRELERRLEIHRIPLRVVPGGDVRIEPDLVSRLRSGDVLTLADSGRHVLLELPHEIYLPLDRLLEELAAAGYQGILSHPERNQGILKQPELVRSLVDRGCLMQLTADSLLGGFGRRIRRTSEDLLRGGLVHFISTDAHSTHSRKPQMQDAFRRAVDLVGWNTAVDLCCRNPARVVAGSDVAPQVRRTKRATAFGWLSWTKWKKAG